MPKKILALFFFTPALLYAVILEVPGQFNTIQAAIDSSLDGDTVLVSPGFYDENIDYIGKSIVVASLILTTGDEAYIDSTIIDGGGRDCCVAFNNAEDENAVLRGFTIQNGYQNFGGGIDVQNDAAPVLEDLCVTRNNAVHIGAGIYCTWDSYPIIRRVLIEDNTAEEGAGFGFAHTAHPIVSDVIVRNNTASMNGGGVFAGHGGGQCTLEDVEIYNNYAQRGGGLYFNFSYDNALNNVQIYNNTAQFEGGGMYANTAEIVVNRCSITGNGVQDGVGGGLYATWESNLIYDHCRIDSNYAHNGGGFFLTNITSVDLWRCTVNFNTALNAGGGISSNESSYFNAFNCNIYGNAADTSGGGIFASVDTKTLILNSILWDNLPSSVECDTSEEEPSPDTLLFYHSVIETELDSIVRHFGDYILWDSTSISEDPLFVNPENDSFGLTAESPCVDAGTALFVVEADTLQDTLLYYTEDEYIGNTPDIGLYESEYVNAARRRGQRALNRFILKNPYPNPFNSTALLQFYIHRPGRFALNVYNTRGRLVETLSNRRHLSGWHEIEWKPDDFSGGIYFVAMSGDRERMVKRLVFLK